MQIHRLNYAHPSWPRRLLDLPQPPRWLFAIGNLQILNIDALAVVGSRAITPYGKNVTIQITTEVAWSSIAIVSGLALGVDSVAHRAALDAKGSTIAVLPGGIERIYPASHRQLAEDIVRHGGLLISEYEGDRRPRKQYFIARNRLIAGLSQAVLITEAAEKSGSLHTAQFALEQGKDVMAVPGSIFSANSVGTHNLINQGAQLVQDSQDVLAHFKVAKSAQVP